MLNAEDPFGCVLERCGTFGNIFHILLRAAASRISPDIRIESTEYDVRKGEYPTDLSLVDAILITGSASSAYEDVEWIRRLDEYVLELYTNGSRIKMFGSCFGHQLICQSLLKGYGVRVEKDPKGYEMGVHEITLPKTFRSVLESSSKNSVPSPTDSLLQALPERMRLQFVHGDHVVFPSPESLPDSWTNVGSTEHCAVQGVYQQGRVFTLQGHFEFDRFINTETLKHFGSAMGWSADTLLGYLNQVDADDDSELAAEMVVRFFLEDGPSNTSTGSTTVSGLLTPPLEE